jgi:hypothetical protein
MRLPQLAILVANANAPCPPHPQLPTNKQNADRDSLKLSQVDEELKAIERNALNPEFREKNYEDLENIEQRVGNIKVSMLDAKELYDLKSHVGEVRGRLNSLSQRKS